MKKCSALYNIREIQIQIARKYLPIVRSAHTTRNRNKINNQNCAGIYGNCSSSFTIGVNGDFPNSLESNMNTFQKLVIEILYGPAIQSFGICPKCILILFRKEVGIYIFIGAVFRIAKIWKHFKYPRAYNWARNYYLYSGILLFMKRRNHVIYCNVGFIWRTFC